MGAPGNCRPARVKTAKASAYNHCAHVPVTLAAPVAFGYRMSARRFASRLAAPLAAALLAAVTLPAAAHIALVTKTASVGSYYKATFRVPHGCAGSDTVAIKVRIPAGVVDVKPQPKPGWKLTLQSGPYAAPVKLHGTTVDQGVREVSWSGGDLPDTQFDEFSFMAYLAPTLAAGSTLYFPLVQECRHGTERWIDTDSQGAANPAPALHLLAADTK